MSDNPDDEFNYSGVFDRDLEFVPEPHISPANKGIIPDRSKNWPKELLGCFGKFPNRYIF